MIKVKPVPGGSVETIRARCLSLLVDELRAARDRGDFDAAKHLSILESKRVLEPPEFTMRYREGAATPFLDGPDR